MQSTALIPTEKETSKRTEQRFSLHVLCPAGTPAVRDHRPSSWNHYWIEQLPGSFWVLDCQSQRRLPASQNAPTVSSLGYL